jgi:hypothetical protein
MRNTWTVLAAVTALLVGCSEPKVDTTSDETTKASIEKVKKSLPEEKRGEFDKALQLLAFSQLDLKSLMSEGTKGADSVTGKMKAAIHGKTGTEIIAEAQKIEAERKERERVQALAEIKELEEKRVKATEAKKSLAKFEIIRSRFYKQKREFMGNQPIIELSVRNGTGHAVSRAYFSGTLASPNRSVPWLKDQFNYSISGGLEAGEKATWKLAPNMFSDWGKVDAPSDAILTVEVEKLDGADGKALYSTREFSEQDAQRLEKLKKEYGVSG